MRVTATSISIAAGLWLAAASALAAPVGSVFVSGHDSDFHAISGNTLGAQHIIQDALTFVRNGNTAPILFLETDPAPNIGLGDHTDSELGLNASGFSAGNTPGAHYVRVTAAQFATATLSQFSAIFVPSDHGGSLTESDLHALNARSSDILSYLNNGGGLAAFAEDGNHAGRPGSGAEPLFGFLPFLVSSTSFQQFESGNTLTSFGTGLGLTSSDINGNFSHNIFTATGGMNIVDQDANGDILSLDFRGQLTPTGVVPEPGTLALLAAGLIGLGLRRR